MLRVVAIGICLCLNLPFWAILILIGGLFKLLTFGAPRRRVINVLSWLAERWIQVNDAVFDTFLSTEWRMTGLEELRRDRHYLLISNHVSWIDIFAVQRAFLDRGPFIRFFIKQALIWSPFLGQAAWALEFPFMRRYSREYLEQHPEKRGRDLETTRIACRRYRGIPVAILNYVEGTRFSPEKHAEQASPYKHLLRPRVGGIAFVLASFSEQLDALYDITVVYPKRDVTILDFVTNRLPWIALHARRIDVPAEFRSDAITQPGPEREHFKTWVEQLWREKDELIERMLANEGRLPNE
ncbi:MAG TPA: acyltransferase [Thermoanaerobaculia bacterium]|nr:acyltransferase [Thermoanaerobaculia bacterium]